MTPKLHLRQPVVEELQSDKAHQIVFITKIDIAVVSEFSDLDGFDAAGGSKTDDSSRVSSAIASSFAPGFRIRGSPRVRGRSI